MTFSSNLRQAAIRHLETAEQLLAPQKSPAKVVRWAQAGYLLGLSAECSVKQVLLDLGHRPDPNNPRSINPLFAHYPHLRTMLRNHAFQGRFGQQLSPFAADNFLAHWDVRMRYAPSIEVKDDWVNRWKAQAKMALGRLGA